MLVKACFILDGNLTNKFDCDMQTTTYWTHLSSVRSWVFGMLVFTVTTLVVSLQTIGLAIGTLAYKNVISTTRSKLSDTGGYILMVYASCWELTIPPFWASCATCSWC